MSGSALYMTMHNAWGTTRAMSRLAPPIRSLVACLLLLLAAAVRPVQASDGSPVLVFAAASTREAVEAVLDLAKREHGIATVASFAGSGTLARQIEAGAPADLFLSANTEWMDRLADSGAIDRESRAALVGNALVMIAPKNAPEGAETSAPPVTHLTEAWLNGRLSGGDFKDGRLAIGDPRAVPAGIYARQALERLGLWQSVAQRLAPTPDVRTALALVERGAAPLGIVYRTDALASRGVAIVAEIPSDSHAPIRYPLALTARGARSEAAGRLRASFLSPEGVAAFTARGFLAVE